MHTRALFRVGGWIVAGFTAALAAGAENSSTATLRVRQDTNLFLQNDAPLAAGASSIGAPARESAMLVQAAWSFREAWHRGEAIALEATYGVEASRYPGHASENHLDHALGFNASGKRDAWAAELKARYLYVDGSREAPAYNCLGGAPAIGGEPVRARREQASTRLSARLTRTAGHGFTRGVFSWLDNDFRTRQRATTGYVNYTDRSEWLVGADAGRRGAGNFAVFAGVRAGAQHQADILGVAHNYSNSVRRALLGAEGNLTPTLQLAVTAGPDWRTYGDSVRAGFARHRRTGFVDAAFTWTPNGRDALSLGAKRSLWLGSGGRSAYLDTSIDLGWKRKLAGGWTLGANGNFHEGDSTRYNAAPRRDRIYTTTLIVGRSFGRGTRFDLEVMHDWAASLVPGTPGREYSRWIPALGVSRAW